jgi:MSHA biogenesis protein MshM
MIQTLLGLQRRPFALTAEDAPYAGTDFEQALALVSEALEVGEAMLVLTGEPGVGKSLLARTLAARLTAAIAYVATTPSDRTTLLQAILYDLNLPHEGRSEGELRLALMDHLLSEWAAGHRTILLVDEAHTLSFDLLEELRTLTNLEGAVQIVLIGQPLLRDHLARAEAAALRQRVALQLRLNPLSVEESADYILHHLRQAGASPHLIGTEALELIALATGGIPRRINQVMHRALRVASQAEANEIEVEIVLDVLTSLGLPTEPITPDEAEDPATPACRLFAPAHRA